MSLILVLVQTAFAQDFGYVAIMQQTRSALLAKDYKTAKTLLTAAEAAAPTSSSPLSQADIALLPFYRGLIEWRSGDKDNAALGWWRKVLVVAPEFEPDLELLPETDGQDVLYALRGEVRNYPQFNVSIPDDTGDAMIFIDGHRPEVDEMLFEGRHLVQVRCTDGSFMGSWHHYGQAPPDYLVLCTGGAYPVLGKDGKPDKAAAAAAAKAAKEAQKAAAVAEAKAAKAAEAKAKADKVLADKAAAEKAAADKAAAEVAAAEKAAADKVAADKSGADKAAADKAAADKAAADKVAADKSGADKAAADKAAAGKGGADKATADKAAADKAAADKAAADKAAADKAAADKAAADKAAADKAAADKAAADKAAADKAAADNASTDRSGSAARIERDPGFDLPAVLLMAGGGGLIAGGVAMNFLVVEPAYAAITDANADPGTMSADSATAWEGRFDIGRYSTIGLIGGGVALLGTGVALQLLDSPVLLTPGGIVVHGNW